jgi:DNA-binding MarR family transcriptional regulator
VHAQEPPWLDDTEMAAWRSLMGLMVIVPAQLDAQMQRVADLTQFEYLILAQLSEAPERRMRISTLAARWFGSLSRLSHLIKRLEQRGWVQRVSDPDDGRYTIAVLTEAGWDKIVQTAPEQVEIVRRLVLDHLTRTQLRQTQVIARRLIDANIDDRESSRKAARRDPRPAEDTDPEC